jgi:SulP family sulfate permease
VLVLQGLEMLAPTLWQTPQWLWGGRRQAGRPDFDRRQRRLLAANWGVTGVVALSTVALGLAWALLIGASFAVLLFVRANMRDVVRRVHSGAQRRSLRIRGPEALQTLQREGGRIAVLELQGALFFGTADALRTRLQALAETVDSVILDLHQVGEIDATGARILLETGEDWAQRGKQLVAAEWLDDDPRRRTVMAMATPGSRPGLLFAADTDLALEAAEDRLLARPGTAATSERRLTLGETLLGRGLGSAELALLAARMAQLQVPRGEVLFRVGDPGDAVYVSLAGTIGLRLPGSHRRLASFAPGVCLGEMAVLDRRQRSAEAVAESDLTVLRLSADAFDAIRAEQPALAALLLHNISLHLTDRVRALTTELAGWVSRSASGRVQELAAPPSHGDDELAV